MDRIKLEQLICDNMKSIFGFSLTRLGNVTDAEDLAGEILYEILRAAQSLRDENRFYGFMWKIAENTYVDFLRKKSKIEGRTAEMDENIRDDAVFAQDELIQNEERNLLRRELSLLSKQYRDATVLYYMENLSCSEIANKLQISTEMVKYYLFRARKIIREGMNMERLYGEKSYRPCAFEIDFWGTKAGDDHEYRDFKRRKIKGNILLAAYYNPVTLQEISIELGVALPYLEDEVKLLLEKGYLMCKNGKYLTNVPIFTLECNQAIDERLKELTENTAKRFVAVSDGFNETFGNKFANDPLARWQKLLLCLHFSLIETERSLKKQYSDFPAEGPYSRINGGGGRGIIWGRSFETSASMQDQLPHGIQGIYNGALSSDRKGSVIAINFRQILNAQHFEYGMTDPVVRLALDGQDGLSEEWKKRLDELGYTDNGKASFPVWSKEEYAALRSILKECTDLVSELSQSTSEIAARITGDLAPTHIRKTAEYVGAFVYRFNAIENLANTLFDLGWLQSVHDKEKAAVCVVKN